MATVLKKREAERRSRVIKCQFREAADQLRELSRAVNDRIPIRRAFEQAEASLAALPLGCNDFLVARGRLRHAKKLVWHGDLASATKELNLVAECLFTGI